MSDEGLFPATVMPDSDWWHALWPDAEGVLRAVGIKPGMQVVDLCCGDGHFTQPMCHLVHPGKAWALDLDAMLLGRAERTCQNNPNFQAILGDARDLPGLIDKPVDFVFIANTFHGVPDKTALSRKVPGTCTLAGKWWISGKSARLQKACYTSSTRSRLT